MIKLERERERQIERETYIERLLELDLRQTLHATEISSQNATQLVAGDAVGLRGCRGRSIAAGIVREDLRGRERVRKGERDRSKEIKRDYKHFQLALRYIEHFAVLYRSL